MKLYEKSGVNLSQAQKLNKKLSKELGISTFAGKTFLSNGFKFVTCCDGIGSKIIPLYEDKLYKTIAIDVVAANLNDLICSGATAIGFVDYLAVNKLDSDAVFQIVQAIDEELKKCSCKLLGGETSEISELITQNNIDISGFAVGIVPEGEELDKKNIKANDVVVGLCSSGIHANGFSLIRKLYQENLLTDEEFQTCLAPSYIYYNTILKLVQKKLIKSCANITGGGILSNLLRVIPDDLSVKLDFDKIPHQKVFQKLKQICGDEFYEVFNAGVGFCLIAEEKNLQEIFEICKEFSPFIFGKIN
ncbi:MAG: phosphoribosylformylglycinamidine cyclo-ligase [Candidatus Gastranaerophilales bacterium]|nr:phosphoribosylformylglycinamidine cyclo-ligase [Candidatus Gastranaerophilales bacterium]